MGPLSFCRFGLEYGGGGGDSGGKSSHSGSGGSAGYGGSSRGGSGRGGETMMKAETRSYAYAEPPKSSDSKSSFESGSESKESGGDDQGTNACLQLISVIHA